jgi:hypothetical protein
MIATVWYSADPDGMLNCYVEDVFQFVPVVL